MIDSISFNTIVHDLCDYYLSKRYKLDKSIAECWVRKYLENRDTSFIADYNTGNFINYSSIFLYKFYISILIEESKYYICG